MSSAACVLWPAKNVCGLQLPLGAVATVSQSGQNWFIANLSLADTGSVDLILVSLMMSLGPRQPRLDSGSLPAGWFPLPVCCSKGFWAATHLPLAIRL